MTSHILDSWIVTSLKNYPFKVIIFYFERTLIFKLLQTLLVTVVAFLNYLNCKSPEMFAICLRVCAQKQPLDMSDQ